MRTMASSSSIRWQLRSQLVVMSGDDMIAQLGDRRVEPIATLQPPPVELWAVKRLEHPTHRLDVEPAALARLRERLAATEAVVKPQALEHLRAGGLLGDQEAKADARLDHATSSRIPPSSAWTTKVSTGS
jgi:hypothetical protein